MSSGAEPLRQEAYAHLTGEPLCDIQKAEKRIEELEAEVVSWIADRDQWISRYEAIQKENATLLERLQKAGML